uniref:Uncharacterized protein n=1 Tax=Avena sativa TaxID=4498 RepID=A0ACD6A3K5_AVESA
MDDSSLFLQWAVNTLQYHEPGVLAAAAAAEDAVFPSLLALRQTSQATAAVLEPTELVEETENSGDIGGGMAIDCVWSMSPDSSRTSDPRSIASVLPMSWNFSDVSAQPSSGGGGTVEVTDVAAISPEMVYGLQPTRRAYSQEHTMAERKRREKMNQYFIELSAVIPGLKKMDKATILTEAVRHVKELQERVKSLEAAAGAINGRNIQTVVLVKKKACVVAPGDDQSSLARSSAACGMPARSPLPEIEAKLSDNNMMVRIHCENGKGLVMRVLAEIEELHLRIVNSNVTPFTASTVIITITAKAS